MSAMINNSEKNVKPVKKAEAQAPRKSVEADSGAFLSPIERAYRACRLNESENFTALGRLLAVRS
ncbi:MAG: hypothetical protein ACOX0A_07660 [Thermoguttaceae bacterium]|jgi:hypothetical protein